MAKLQYVSLATTLSILSLSTIGDRNTARAIAVGKQKPILSLENSISTSTTAIEQYQLAQKQGSNNSDSDDEMLDALQERQDKIDRNLEKLRKITGTEPQKPEKEQNSSGNEDELIDALENRQQKIQELKELKKLNDILKNQEMLDTLQEQNFNVNSLEELETIKEIVNDESLAQEEMLDALQEQNFNIGSVKELKKLRKTLKDRGSTASKSSGISNSFTFRMLIIGLPATVLVFLVASPFIKGIAGVVKNNYQEKYGKPKVPEGSLNLHSRSFKEITLIGNKAEKINNEKFGNEEFLLLLKIKINMSKEAEGYKGLSNCVDLLQAAIIAQKSFLRLEQTELRYRSRKQQEFYQYVADNLVDNIDQRSQQAPSFYGGVICDKEDFAKKVNKKQTEILPLITTEEGRAAIDTYTKEINVLSKYQLGLKLLALFKQYELQDFSILKQISDVVESLEGKDLLSSSDLVSPVLENYESFEKLGPILGISPAESTPQAYAKILQVIGLTNRHGKAYLEFAQLVKLLKKWEQPYKAISLVRKEYTEDRYNVPPEFKENIPGLNTYQKYAEYLPDL